MDSAAQLQQKRTVLIALCGLSPAVITETVWALTEAGTVPDDVIVLTTEQGREALKRDLFDSGIWRALRQTLGLPDDCARFGPSHYHIRLTPEESRSGDAADIRAADDASAFGDFVLGVLREFTENPDTQIVFSIAGGRKSMSAIATQCMSLLARSGDRVCHILVAEPFENPQLEPKFFFPSDIWHRKPDGDNVRGDSVSAAIALHDIPFVRCREVFVREYDRLPGSFCDTVQAANRRLSLPVVQLSPRDKACAIDGCDLNLSWSEFAFFWFLCERTWEGMPPLDNATIAHLNLSEFVDRADVKPVLASACIQEPSDDTEGAVVIRHLADRIKRKLKNLAGDVNVEPLYPSRGRGKGYGLDIPSENIQGIDA